MDLLRLDEAPQHPIERIVWLDGVLTEAKKELNYALQEAYYEARVQGMFPEALALGLHSQKRALAWTRHANEARGRAIANWRDGY